jgi:hypothetical protein
LASIWGSQVQPDTQLVFLGVINKILDYLVANVIEHIAQLIFTLWMIRGPPGKNMAGAYPVDFEMKEELLKTWITTTNFIERSRVFGWPKFKGMNGTSCFRFFIALVVSVCFLLQGVAINTVGLPKARWDPDLLPKTEAK